MAIRHLVAVCLLACGAWADPITFVRPERQLESAAAVKDAGSSMRFRATTTVAKVASKSGASVAATTAAAATVAVAATVTSKTGGLLNATCTRVYPTFCTMVRPLAQVRGGPGGIVCLCLPAACRAGAGCAVRGVPGRVVVVEGRVVCGVGSHMKCAGS